MKKYRIFIIAGLLVLISLVYWFLVSSKIIAGGSNSLKVKVKKEDFEISVTTTGELQPIHSEDIKGPAGLQMAEIWQVKISALIPEGSVVKKGDYVATLDQSDIGNKMKDLGTEISKTQADFTNQQLDTTLQLRKLRDDLVNQKFDMEEKELNLKQSQYETPAAIREAEIDLAKAKRTYEQAVKNYKLNKDQNAAKMQQVGASLEKAKSKYEQMGQLLQGFTITAPHSGMLIYRKEWNGHKLTVGGTLNTWDPVVATLPDLSAMISKTFVNEVDINKIKVGQNVKIGVDAFPERKYTGKITSVANVGEQLPGNDSRVFEVDILLNETDTLLRPALTTSNTIYAQKLKNALVLPIDCLKGNDTLVYVYKQDGDNIVKQEVLKGPANTDEVCVLAGLKENDDIYLSEPENAGKLALVKLPAHLKPKPKPVKLADTSAAKPNGIVNGISAGQNVIILK